MESKPTEYLTVKSAPRDIAKRAIRRQNFMYCFLVALVIGLYIYSFFRTGSPF